jgi:hypothetical protein
LSDLKEKSFSTMRKEALSRILRVISYAEVKKRKRNKEDSPQTNNNNSDQDRTWAASKFAALMLAYPLIVHDTGMHGSMS